MEHPVDSAGLQRLVKLELSRLVPGTPEEARAAMQGRIGVYDFEGTVIEAGVNSYFSSRAIRN